MIQKHFLNPTRFYMLFIDIRVTLVINIITLCPLHNYVQFFYIYYTYVFLYHSFIIILSFSQYCQICYHLICCTIFNQNLTYVMLQIIQELLFLGGHVISTSIMFLYGPLGTTYIIFFLITYVLYIII